MGQFVGASLVKEDEIMYKDKIKQYIYSLGEKREQFGGMSACPFAVPELESGRLFIAKIDDEHSFHDLLAFFISSTYESALFAVEDADSLTEEETIKYQTFIDSALKSADCGHLKAICFSPKDRVSEIEGYNPRADAPFFLINIAKKKVLNKAHKKLLSTSYYDKLTEEYRKFLHISDQMGR